VERNTPSDTVCVVHFNPKQIHYETFYDSCTDGTLQEQRFAVYIALPVPAAGIAASGAEF
jgi:hypothetical protein